MNDITININGGNNQILPNATEAVQNFYGDQFAEKILSNTVVDKESCPEVGKLSLYVDKVNLPDISPNSVSVKMPPNLLK